jgi:hypothetical protein
MAVKKGIKDGEGNIARGNCDDPYSNKAYTRAGDKF